MKIKVYTHKIKINIQDDLQKVKEYFVSPFVASFGKTFPMTFDIEETNISKEHSLPLFKNSKYDLVIYITDSSILNSTFFGWTFIIDGYVGIYLKCDALHDSVDYTWKSLAHEIMHALRMKKELELKRPIPDPMDEFRRNGEVFKYFKNDDPYAIDGNFAESFKILNVFYKDEVILKRQTGDNKQTLGILEYKGQTFKTLELPDFNNMPNISCIPKGRYKVKWTLSPRFMKYTYEIIGVPNRSGIRIHSANYYYQLNGCIALGTGLLDINKDGKLDMVNSRIAIKSFEDLLGRKEFTINII